MRVITGLARGMKLFSTEGLETRPTSDWTKESIFNIIQFDIEGRRVLDLFSGTGQMGIEALSRGARECVFIDNRRESIDVTTKNVEKTGFRANSVIQQSDYMAYLKRCAPGSFGLIFLDPPYGSGMLERALRAIFSRDLLSDGGLIVCEGEKNDYIPDAAAPYFRGREYNYGKTRITLFRKRQESTDEDGSLPGQL